jgi:hypothetical protein
MTKQEALAALRKAEEELDYAERRVQFRRQQLQNAIDEKADAFKAANMARLVVERIIREEGSAG